MKKIGIVVVFLVMLSLTMSASALESKTITRNNGVSAYASWDKTTADGYEFTYLGVMESKTGTDVFVYTCKYDQQGNGTCKDGSASTTDDVLTVDNKLNSATLSTNVNMYDYNTGEITIVPITVSWTGAGDLVRSNSHSISKSSDFIFKFSDSVVYRTAVATGTFDGNDLGNSNYAEIDQFKTASMSTTK
jgi:hypothetical protein